MLTSTALEKAARMTEAEKWLSVEIQNLLRSPKATGLPLGSVLDAFVLTAAAVCVQTAPPDKGGPTREQFLERCAVMWDQAAAKRPQSRQ
jgi:hypothetical protein